MTGEVTNPQVLKTICKVGSKGQSLFDHCIIGSLRQFVQREIRCVSSSFPLNLGFSHSLSQTLFKEQLHELALNTSREHQQIIHTCGLLAHHLVDRLTQDRPNGLFHELSERLHLGTRQDEVVHIQNIWKFHTKQQIQILIDLLVVQVVFHRLTITQSDQLRVEPNQHVLSDTFSDTILTRPVDLLGHRVLGGSTAHLNGAIRVDHEVTKASSEPLESHQTLLIHPSGAVDHLGHTDVSKG